MARERDTGSSEMIRTRQGAFGRSHIGFCTNAANHVGISIYIAEAEETTFRAGGR